MEENINSPFPLEMPSAQTRPWGGRALPAPPLPPVSHTCRQTSGHLGGVSFPEQQGINEYNTEEEAIPAHVLDKGAGTENLLKQRGSRGVRRTFTPEQEGWPPPLCPEGRYFVAAGGGRVSARKGRQGSFPRGGATRGSAARAAARPPPPQRRGPPFGLTPRGCAAAAKEKPLWFLTQGLPQQRGEGGDGWSSPGIPETRVINPQAKVKPRGAQGSEACICLS